MMERSDIRNRIKHKLLNQTEAERKRKSSVIQNRLLESDEFRKAHTVMVYVSTDGEVMTDGVIQRSLDLRKRVGVPVTVIEEKRLVVSLLEDPEKELVRGPYGILQPATPYIKPITPEEIDLIVAPGIAFDVHGNRLGRGAGYYDRFLETVPKDTPVIGFAFDFQVLPELPLLPHDVPVTKVLSA
ncbi:MAG: 5-formyltetrahydrofolate cyclo-ligase [Candidatus Omnitrophica bacterium]|nr:5-formyltetrahydrofolate cyclo-ligase [Candidatus Omnitrophota bacterium]